MGLSSLQAIYLGSNYGGGNEDNGDLLQRSHVCTAALSAPSPAAGHCQPTPPLETSEHSGQVWVSLLWGHCSFLLGPGAHKALFLPSKGLFPQSCVSSGGSMVGLLVTSSKRAYAIPRPAAPRAPAPQQSTADLYLHRRMLDPTKKRYPTSKGKGETPERPWEG